MDKKARDRIHRHIDKLLDELETFAGPEKWQEMTIPGELFDFILVMKDGLKHGVNNWLNENPDGTTMDRKNNYASITRHSANYFTGHDIDPVDNLHHLLKSSCRGQMAYVRYKLNLKME